jgi:hypothetical protein
LEFQLDTAPRGSDSHPATNAAKPTPSVTHAIVFESDLMAFLLDKHLQARGNRPGPLCFYIARSMPPREIPPLKTDKIAT